METIIDQKNNFTLEISNISKEINTEELEHTYKLLGITTYNEYLNFVVIKGIDGYLNKSLNPEQLLSEERKYNFDINNIHSHLNIKDDIENPKKCVISLQFKLENNILTIL